jgi:hypothetical protein
MTDRVAQLEAALRAENDAVARDGCCAIVCASAQNAGRAGVRVVARRSKRVLSRLFRLKKKLPGQIFGLMGS